MDQPTILLSATLLGLVAYPLVMRWLALIVRNKRLQLVQLAERLAHEEDLDHDWREMIAWMLETAFSPRVMIGVAFSGLLYVVELITRRYQSSLPEVEPRLQQTTNELMSCYIASIAAANPIFAIIVAFEIATLTFIGFPFGRQPIGGFQRKTLFRVEQRLAYRVAASY